MTPFISDTTCLLDPSSSSSSLHRLWRKQRKSTRKIIHKIKESMDARSALADTMLMAVSTALQVVPRRSSRRLSDFSDIAHLTVQFDGVTLNHQQRKLIKNGYDSWRKKSCISSGRWVHSFVSSKDDRLKEIMEGNEETTRIHEETITHLLDMAVESLESLDDSLGPLLISYTGPQGVFEEKDGFDRLYWSRVSEGMCQLARNFPSKANKYETVCAWRIVVLFICNKIELGFNLLEKESRDGIDNPCYGTNH
ncbi:hypothetical protein PRIPAC_84405 [Pristionchus pacificus]|uniref:Uncharacterized protein n=1 Tax=Pristionchus pacificus TaxID=54126 RepID=A0A2A6D1B3_PRIPA|nr:hypothetical protein PRIPAC_84405 [Pristionchus pacificus]|eukprot:PDM84170.1 hypothetical protein PRIPAC_35146 [Pristionchus pacificus]